MGYVVKHSSGNVNKARKKGNVALGVDADGYDKTSVSGFYAGVAPVPGFHNLVKTSASTDPDFYTLTDLELVNFANSLGGSVSDVAGAKVYLASRNDIMFTDEVPEDTVTDNLILDANITNPSSFPESGSTIYDISGNGDTITLYNGSIVKENRYIEFDGSNDRAYSSNDYTYGNETTWIATVKRDTNNNEYNMFMGDYLPYFGFRAATNYKFHFSNQISGNQRDVYSTTQTSTGTWYHVVFTTSYNGSQTTMKVYVNGNNDGTSTHSGNQTQQSGQPKKFTIGDGRSNATWYPLDGKVSNVKIYDKTLSSSEILQNYYKGNIVTDNLYAAFDSDNLVSHESGSSMIYNLVDPSDTTSDGTVNSDIDFTLNNTLAFGKDRNTTIEHVNPYPTGSFDFPGWNGYSVGIWVKRTKYGTWKSGNTHYDGIWNYYWNHNLYFSGANTGLNRIQGTGLSGYDINMDEWYYVVTTHDNNAASNNHKVYINGELEQTSHVSNPTYSNNAPRRFYVGNWDSGWSMVGEIGAYHIYDQAITADEVLQNYNTYKSRYQNQDPTLEIDGDWLKVFRHYSGDNDFFSSSNDWAEAKSTNTDNPQANKYSILDTLYRYELDGKFTFKIVYPSQSLENSNYSNVTNIWSQTNNPVRDDGSGGVTGYTAIDIDSNSSGWGGLERYDAQSSTFLDGTLSPQSNWWWAVGSRNTYDSGNPNFPGPGQTTRLVELWVKYK
jgi:hypothetical protein